MGSVVGSYWILCVIAQRRANLEVMKQFASRLVHCLRRVLRKAGATNAPREAKILGWRCADGMRAGLDVRCAWAGRPQRGRHADGGGRACSGRGQVGGSVVHS